MVGSWVGNQINPWAHVRKRSDAWNVYHHSEHAYSTVLVFYLRLTVQQNCGYGLD